ncbi:hypothetical protein B0H16DRAFT_376001 [Mycena metata]|uniref:Uncharacterized protein n=1 Tax=Mycena metata TaxID=1033252 RepID=A0AAD7MKK0_9AGAR|nr:hypothetical protein B0H16DRAFT_376001 [Mycena metata]
MALAGKAAGLDVGMWSGPSAAAGTSRTLVVKPSPFAASESPSPPTARSTKRTSSPPRTHSPPLSSRPRRTPAPGLRLVALISWPRTRLQRTPPARGGGREMGRRRRSGGVIDRCYCCLGSRVLIQSLMKRLSYSTRSPNPSASRTADPHRPTTSSAPKAMDSSTSASNTPTRRYRSAPSSASLSWTPFLVDNVIPPRRLVFPQSRARGGSMSPESGYARPDFGFSRGGLMSPNFGRSEGAGHSPIMEDELVLRAPPRLTTPTHLRAYAELEGDDSFVDAGGEIEIEDDWVDPVSQGPPSPVAVASPPPPSRSCFGI